MATKSGRTRRTAARSSVPSSRPQHKRAPSTEDDESDDDDDFGEYERKTWREDKIWDLPAGFTAIDKVGCGVVYYRHGDAVVEYGWEFSGVSSPDILFWNTDSLRWIDVHTLECKPVSPAERKSIKKGLVNFLYSRGARFSLDNRSYRNPQKAHPRSPRC